MSNNNINMLILETQLILLKKDSDWWITGGIAFIVAGFINPLSIITFFFVPFLIIGVLVLIKGISLRLSWENIRKRYFYEIYKQTEDSDKRPDKRLNKRTAYKKRIQ
jgi:hypothetical protein